MWDDVKDMIKIGASVLLLIVVVVAVCVWIAAVSYVGAHFIIKYW